MLNTILETTGDAAGAGIRIGVDIGGTFTDLVLIAPGGRVHFQKIASTPEHPERAVITGIQSVLEETGIAPREVVEVLHGTTVASNAVLEKTGARAGLITTRGFRDVLEIGRLRTPEMFDLGWDKPEPLVERRFRREVRGRIAADGSELEPLSKVELLSVTRELLDEGVDSLALCFINSYRNPVHEQAAELLLRREFPDLALTTSVSVLPEIKEYERTSTTVVNAYVLPVVRAYLRNLQDGLKAAGIHAPLLVVTSNGGLATAGTAADKPVFFISSGPAAGVVGAARAGRAAGVDDMVVFDMGGTTAKASLVRGGVVMRATEYEFRSGISMPSRFIKAGGYMMKVPTVDISEVGSGAGSIAWVDEGGLLRVGPRSAGAVPGPACYGQGGDRPTVTDCNVVLGWLNPHRLAGGRLAIEAECARAVVEHDLACPLGLTLEDAAAGVRAVVNADMARAIRAVTVERGIDPRQFALVAFGGSGPVHACDVARTVGMRRVLIPNLPGVFTALGMLTSDGEHHFIRAHPEVLGALTYREANTKVAAMENQAREALLAEGYNLDHIALRYEIDLRFRGQDSELAMAFEAPLDEAAGRALRDRFLEEYERVYQYTADDEIEVVNLRLVGRGIREDKLDFRTLDVREGSADESACRHVYFGREHGWLGTPVLTRDQLAEGLHGPLVVESPDSTLVVPPGAKVERDEANNILIHL